MELTLPQSVVIGAALIAASIIGTTLVAPYRIASGTGIVWRVNSFTGKVQLCNFEIDVRNPEMENACR